MVKKIRARLTPKEKKHMPSELTIKLKFLEIEIHIFFKTKRKKEEEILIVPRKKKERV